MSYELSGERPLSEIEVLDDILSDPGLPQDIIDLVKETKNEVIRKLGSFATDKSTFRLNTILSIRNRLGLSDQLQLTAETESAIIDSYTDDNTETPKVTASYSEQVIHEDTNNVYVFDHDNGVIRGDDDLVVKVFNNYGDDMLKRMQMAQDIMTYIAIGPTEQLTVTLLPDYQMSTTQARNIFNNQRKIVTDTLVSKVLLKGPKPKRVVERLEEFSVASKWPSVSMGADINVSHVDEDPANNQDTTHVIEDDNITETSFFAINYDTENTLTDEQASAIINFLRGNVPAVSTDEAEENFRLQIAKIERARSKKSLYRLDVDQGLFAGNSCISDATDSPNIKVHIDKLVDGIMFLSGRSSIGQDFVSNEEIYKIIDPDNTLNDVTKKMILREINRMLKGTGKLYQSRDKLDKNSTTGFTLLSEFKIVVTEVGAPKNTNSHQRVTNKSIESYIFPTDAAYDSIFSILNTGKLPIPRNHQEAILLLDVVMDAELKETIQNKFGTEYTAELMDYAHNSVRHILGSSRYFFAKRTRTIRSGKPGNASVVRQITGSQTLEIFKKSSNAEPDTQVSRLM